jgi:integrase/recombinase XerD
MDTALLHLSAENVLSTTIDDMAGQLAPTSQRIYKSDALHFVAWLSEHGITPEHMHERMSRSVMIAYRRHLAEDLQERTGKPYSKATAGRMLSVACRLMDEAYRAGQIKENVTADIRGFKRSGDETTHTALTKSQARNMLDGIDTSTAKGKRDYALVLTLVKTGMRRMELVALNVGDLTMMDGHTVAIIRHGKGDKLRIVKLRGEVLRAIQQYIQATHREHVSPDAPLFIGFDKGDKPTERRISAKLVECLVKHYAPDDAKELTPHGLRATFATIAFEQGASLHQVQYAMGHSDPRTTEHYQRRKLNLDNHAVDKLDF